MEYDSYECFKYGYGNDEEQQEYKYFATHYEIGWNDIVGIGTGDGSSEKLVAYQWDLSAVKDIYGNTTKIKYQQIREYVKWEESGVTKSTTNQYTVESHPYSINYNNDLSEIRFNLEDRESYEYVDFYPGNDRIQDKFEKKRFKSIYFYNNDVLQDKIFFTYQSGDALGRDIQKSYLTRIYSDEKNGKREVDTDFEYYGVNESESSTIVNYGALKKIINLYGRETTYEYEDNSITKTDLDKDLSSGFDWTSNCFKTGRDFAVIYRVSVEGWSSQDFEVYSWYKGKKWKTDPDFPKDQIFDSGEMIYNIYVHADYIVFEIGTKDKPKDRDGRKLKIVNRDELSWSEPQTITNTGSRSTSGVLGNLNKNYFLIQSIRYDDGKDIYSVVKQNNGEWKVGANRITRYWVKSDAWYKDYKAHTITQPNYFAYWRRNHDNSHNWLNAFILSSTTYNAGNIDYVWNHALVDFDLGDMEKGSDGPKNKHAYLQAHNDYFVAVKYCTCESSSEDDYVIRFFLVEDNDINYKKGFGYSDTGDFDITPYTTLGDYSAIMSLRTRTYVYDLTDMTNITDTRHNYMLFKGFNYNSKQLLYGYYDNSGSKTKLKLANLSSSGTWDFDNAQELLSSDIYIVNQNDGVFPFASGHQIFVNIENDDLNDPADFLINAYYKNGGGYSEIPIINTTIGAYDFDVIRLGRGFIGYTISGTYPVKVKKSGFTSDFTPKFTGNPYHFHVSSTTTSDGNGNLNIVNFNFYNGIFDESISYVKYNKVKQTLPGSNGYQYTYFYNDLSNSDGDGSQFENLSSDSYGFTNAGYLLDGLPYKIETYNNNNELINRTENEWKVKDKSDDSYLIYLEKVTNTTLNDLNNIVSRTAFEYSDDNGQKTKDIVYETNSTTEVRLQTDYTYDDDSNLSSKHILNWPSIITVKDGGGNLLKQTEFVYDYDDLFLKQKKTWLDKNGNGAVNSGEMIAASEVEMINEKGQTVQTRNIIDDIPSCILYDEKNNLPIASFNNAEADETFAEHFDHTDIIDENYNKWHITGDNNWQVHDKALRWTDKESSGHGCSVADPMDITNFIAEFDIKINEYSESGGSWGGFHFRKTNVDHYITSGESSGYLVLLRQNGIVELFRLNPLEAISGRYELADRGGNWNYIHSEWHHIRVEAKGSNIKIYVDGNLAIEENHSQFDGANSYSSFCTYKTDSKFDNLRIYPADAFCTSQSYDTETMQVIGIRSVKYVFNSRFVLRKFGI